MLSFIDLFFFSGNISALGVGFNPTPTPSPPQTTQQQPPNETSASGSDILYAKKHDMKLEKSNIMMFGSTGSGKTLLAQTIARWVVVGSIPATDNFRLFSFVFLDAWTYHLPFAIVPLLPWLDMLEMTSKVLWLNFSR